MANLTQSVEYAGLRRSIIHRKSPLVDDDGYEFDSDDDDARVEEAILSAAELDPYANIRLERMFRENPLGQGRANFDRHPCAAYCLNRPTNPPRPLQAVYFQYPHRTSQAEFSHNAKGKPVAVAGSTLVDLSLWRLHLGAVFNHGRHERYRFLY